MSEPTPTLLPTKTTEVVAAALAGGILAYLVFGGFVRFGQSLPLLGPVAWLSILALGVGIAVLAVRTHRALQVRREQMEHSKALTRLLLGKTSLLGGAFLGAAYLGLAAVAASGWPAPLAVERVVHAGLAVVACVGWATAGWFLEQACRVPRDPDDTTRDTPADHRDPQGPGVA